MPGRDDVVCETVERDPRWGAVRRRDARFDGAFVYAVVTTGVYCRPGCGARMPRPENVSFYATAGEAEAAGFRPCKRCRPDGSSRAEREAKTVEALCRLIDERDEVPTLDELAAHVGLSPFHVHRLFKRITGLTPRAYAEARRANRVRAELDAGRPVTEVIYGTGFESASRFYAQARQSLGMTPSQYRKRGKGLRIRFAVGECSLGSVLVAATERGVCCILLGDDPEALLADLQRRFSSAQLVGADAEFERTVARVVRLIEAPGQGISLPLDIQGTVFQQRVWQAITKIPAGQTMTYTELARMIGASGSARAVASACGANPLAVAIPCHRVVRTDGGLAGYRWGIERKRELLEREGKNEP